MYKSSPIIVYKKSDAKEKSPRAQTLYNSAPHLKTSDETYPKQKNLSCVVPNLVGPQEVTDVNNISQNSPNSMRRGVDDIKRKNRSTSTTKKMIHYTSSEPTISVSPKIETPIYQVFIDIHSESESIELKSDIGLCYDHDGIYNFFELNIVCQQIKCIGQYKTSTTSYDLINQGYNAIHCIDGDQNYLVLSKHILKPKNIILVHKKLPFNIDQFIYYPIYVICSLDMEISDFEALFPYLLYNLLID